MYEISSIQTSPVPPRQRGVGRSRCCSPPPGVRSSCPLGLHEHLGREASDSRGLLDQPLDIGRTENTSVQPQGCRCDQQVLDAAVVATSYRQEGGQEGADLRHVHLGGDEVVVGVEVLVAPPVLETCPDVYRVASRARLFVDNPELQFAERHDPAPFRGYYMDGWMDVR